VRRSAGAWPPKSIAAAAAKASRQAFCCVDQSGCSLIPALVRTHFVALSMISPSCSSASIVASADSSLRRSCFPSSGVSASSRQRSSSTRHCGWRFQTEIVSGATPTISAVSFRERPCACKKPPAGHAQKSQAPSLGHARPGRLPRPSLAGGDVYVTVNHHGPLVGSGGMSKLANEIRSELIRTKSRNASLGFT
jgi:hypothetical protein